MAKRIIVTGAAGFIGRNTVAELNRRGYDNLLLTDILGTDEKWKNLVGLKFDDLISPNDLLVELTDETFDDIETIIHLGACSATTERNADYLLENNTHYTADLAANVVVLIGVISGAFLGAPGLDAAAGIVVAVWLFWGATGMLKAAADHLLDRAVPEADRAAITQAVLADPQVFGVHQLRTRMAGQVMMIQMHVDLDPHQTLDAAHAIVVAAENRVLSHYPAADILIHADPRGRTRPPADVPAVATPAPEPEGPAVQATEGPAPKGPWS